MALIQAITGLLGALATLLGAIGIFANKKQAAAERSAVEEQRARYSGYDDDNRDRVRKVYPRFPPRRREEI